jgi:outer membrane biosynthesis protein TonB
MPRRATLALGLLLATFAVGACGSKDPELIPQSRASQLASTVDEITTACDDNDPDAARAAVAQANDQVSELPRTLNSRLRSNLRAWLSHIEDRVADDCKAQEKTPTPTSTPTATETPSPTATPSPTETPTPTPTPSPSPTPSATPTVEPPGDGGVLAPGGN